MNRFKFKTNINCSGCITTVTPHLNSVEGITEWEVDTTNKDKVLTIVTDSTTQQEVIDTVAKAGFKIESIEN